MNKCRALALAGLLAGLCVLPVAGEEETSGWKLELVSVEPNLYQGEEIEQAAFKEDGYVYVTDKVVAFFDGGGNLRSEVPLVDSEGKGTGRAQISDKGGLVAVEGKPVRVEQVSEHARMRYYTVGIYSYRGELVSTFEVKGYDAIALFEEGGYVVKYGGWPGYDTADVPTPYFAMYDLQGNVLQDMQAPGDVYPPLAAGDLVVVTAAPRVLTGRGPRRYLFRRGKLVWATGPQGWARAISAGGGYLVTANSSRKGDPWSGLVRLVDVETGSVRRERPLDGVRIRTAGIAQTAKGGELILLLGDRQGALLLMALDPLTLVPIWTTEFHVATAQLAEQSEVGLYITPEGLVLVTALASGALSTIHQWSILLFSADGNPVARFALPPADVSKRGMRAPRKPVRLLPDGRSFLFWSPGKVACTFTIVPVEGR